MHIEQALRRAVHGGTVRSISTGLTDAHMFVLWWLRYQPDHGPADIAKGLRAEKDVDEIAKLCADLAAGGYIEPTTWH